MVETKKFNVSDRIELEGACITAFHTVDKCIVEATIESRPYNTVYRIKCVSTNANWRYGRQAYFLQILRVKI